MAESITDANDAVVSVGSTQAGGAKGTIILSDFEITANQDKETQHGIGNQEPQGRQYGNKTYDVSFTHVGEDNELMSEIDDGNFTVKLTGNEAIYSLTDVDYDDWTMTLSDDGTWELDFNGDALGYDRNEL